MLGTLVGWSNGWMLNFLAALGNLFSGFGTPVGRTFGKFVDLPLGPLIG